MRKQSSHGILLALIMLFLLCISLLSMKVNAAGPTQVYATVSDLRILNSQRQEVDHIYHSADFFLSMDWEASANGTGFHAGDYFEIELPNQMAFPTNSSAVDFNLYGADGVTVIATAHVNPYAYSGGNIRVTFTNWVENQYNVSGTLGLAATFKRDLIVTNGTNQLDVTVNGSVGSITTGNGTNIVIEGPAPLSNEYLMKWGI